MWPFKSKETLNKSGMFDGFTDWHSHILPGVDDGISTMEESLAVLDTYEQAGIKRVWLTPHIMEDYPNTPEQLRSRFAELKEAYQGPIELRLAAENMLDPLFEERLEARDLLPIGDEGNHLLVETSYMNPPIGMEDMLENIFAAGYTPLLAHPERYRYMDEKDYYRLRNQGIKFQSNYMSLVGGYGEVARKKIEWLMKEGMVEVVGSDLHRLMFFNHYTAISPKKSQALKSLVEIAQNPKIK